MIYTIYRYLIIGLLCVAPLISPGQHNHHNSAKDTLNEKQVKNEMPRMSHAFSLKLPMSRNGSGTGWLPDSTPMYGYMLHTRKWMFMFHGNIFARYTRTDLFNAGNRGDEKADVVNWFMGMGQRKVGKRGLFRLSTMVSLDNLFGGNGYPLLFQTGETWQGKPLVDRQHPHDLFSEMSLGYTHSLSEMTDVFVYVGYPGEPALGSVAFMHRVSALYGPDAPLSHHWNDGTHITFGVLTGGVRLGKFKLEASGFTGREPDENRYDFDKPRLDSYSGRLSYNPDPYWALQVSQGFVRSPESTRPDENVNRSTASAVYSKPLQHGNFLNVTALWGLNSSHANEHAVLFEVVYAAGRKALYGRYEFVQKGMEELDLDETRFEHDAIFRVQAVSLGFSYDMIRSAALRMALGAQGSCYFADSRLDYLYGENPVSAQVFLRLYPPRMNVTGI